MDERDCDQKFGIHFVNSCPCAECRAWRAAEYSEKRWKQIYWHGRLLKDVCCGDCPDCWHHY